MLDIVKKKDFPGDLVIKDLPVNAADMDSIPGFGSSPGGEKDNPLQYQEPGSLQAMESQSQT